MPLRSAREELISKRNIYNWSETLQGRRLGNETVLGGVQPCSGAAE